MTWVAVAVVGGAAVGAIGSNVAAGKQAAGQQAAADTQKQMFDTLTQQEQPFIKPGYEAETSLAQLLGTEAPTGAGGTASGTNLPGGYLTQTFNPTQQQLEQYPGYQFQLQQGNLALQSANSANGSAISGPALKSLMNFNQGLAASNYNNYFNQFQQQQTNIFNRLSDIAGLGQNAAGNLGNTGAQLGTGIAGAQAAAAGSQAAGIVGASNAIGSAGVPLAYLLSQNSTPQNYGAGTMDAGGGYTFNTGGS